MVGDWKVRLFPRCTHHVFLSHCAEDRLRLVQPVYAALEDAKYQPWLDRHHYPVGTGAFEALREEILRCRHVVYFVTAPFLSQGMGWNSIENAYANLLQENLRFESYELCHVQLPLFFVRRDNVTLQRSAWAPLMPRGRFYPAARVDSGAMNWAAEEIGGFIRQEEKRGVLLATQVENDPSFKKLLKDEPNLLRRIMCADPLPAS
jgi:hypothetical protein